MLKGHRARRQPHPEARKRRARAPLLPFRLDVSQRAERPAGATLRRSRRERRVRARNRSAPNGDGRERSKKGSPLTLRVEPNQPACGCPWQTAGPWQTKSQRGKPVRLGLWATTRTVWTRELVARDSSAGELPGTRPTKSRRRAACARVPSDQDPSRIPVVQGQPQAGSPGCRIWTRVGSGVSEGGKSAGLPPRHTGLHGMVSVGVC